MPIFFSFLASILLHLAVVAVLLHLPDTRKDLPREPVFLDLQDMSELKSFKAPQELKKPARPSDATVRVKRESAPRKDGKSEHVVLPKTGARKTEPVAQPSEQQKSASRGHPLPEAPAPNEKPEAQVPPGSSSTGLLKPRKQKQPVREQFFPGAGKMARLEESYRRSFDDEIAEGDTRFLNTDDILFGSFLRRFENAVYGVWRYPHEAALKGIEGVTPVRISFNREGKIVRVKLLESSGAKILDDEVIRTLNLIGPMGGFPRGYGKDEFHLIAFFRYGGSLRSLR